MASNPTDMETKAKAFDARKALWPEEDTLEEERLRTVGKTIDGALFNTVLVQGYLQWEDQAHLLCKILETFNFSKYFPLDDSSVSILHYLMDELEEYAHKLVDPMIPDQYIKDLPLEDLKGMLKARWGQLCTRLELLRMTQNNLQTGVLGWDDVFLHYRMVEIQLWIEMLNLTLFLRYLSGQTLQEELQEQQRFIQENLIPVMNMFLLEVRDKKARPPVLYADYLITSRASGTLRGEPADSEVSGDGAFRTLVEEAEPLGERVEALTLENPTRHAEGVQETIQAQHEQEAALTVGQGKADRIKSKNVQKILWLSGLSAENKLKMISQLTNPEKKPGDQLDALAGKFNFRMDEGAESAYGDEKAVAQHNTLPKVQLPPFYGNSLEFAKWWQMFIYLVDKNPKIPRNLLQKLSKGNEEYLTYRITFSPQSYDTLKENVKDAFDDADAALRLLMD